MCLSCAFRVALDHFAALCAGGVLSVVLKEVVEAMYHIDRLVVSVPYHLAVSSCSSLQPGRDGGKAKPLKAPKSAEKILTDEVSTRIVAI